MQLVNALFAADRPMVAATGVWSKRIAEANERRGGSTNEMRGMAYGSFIMLAIIGLGFKYKVQLIRELASEAWWTVHGSRVERAQRATARSRAQSQQADEQARQSYDEWRKARARYSASGRSHRVSSPDELASHRTLLGVGAAATKAELKAAYYRAAKRSHPDACGAQGSEAQFAAAKAAYDALLPHVAPTR